MKVFFLLLPILYNILIAGVLKTDKWPDSQTYLVFLQKHNLPQQALYYDLDKEDQKLTEDIYSGVEYQISYDLNKSIEQILIPITDELQIHISKDGNYTFEVIPIVYQTKRHSFVIHIDKSPYQDIVEKVGSVSLAQEFVNAYKNSLNFKRVRKNDLLVMIYEEKYRMGKTFGSPKLLTAMIEMRKKKNYIYLNEDERYYNEDGKQVEGFLLYKPIKNARITSKFTYKRFHPVLKRYRAHLGVDFGARSGTPIYAAGDGKIITAGYSRGYGNVIKIRHSNGYVTLYAHQKKFARGIKAGKWVNKGKLIGYVGSTGLSTGPHLHFGLYKHGRAINPLSVVKVATKKLYGNEYKKFKKLANIYDDEIAKVIKEDISPKKYKDYIFYSELASYFEKHKDKDNEEN